jgi:hypothetical protein
VLKKLLIRQLDTGIVRNALNALFFNRLQINRVLSRHRQPKHVLIGRHHDLA